MRTARRQILRGARLHFAKARRRRRRDWRLRRPNPLCRRCGYNLRGSLGAEVCPECGRQIEWRPPWWRDGRYPIFWVALIGLAPVLTITATDLVHERAGVYASLIVAAAGTLIPFVLGIRLAARNCRRWESEYLRTTLFILATLTAMLVYSVATEPMIP